jgi:hypothetical protein
MIAGAGITDENGNSSGKEARGRIERATDRALVHEGENSGNREIRGQYLSKTNDAPFCSQQAASSELWLP